MLNDQSKEAQDFLARHVHVRANLLINELLEKSQRDWNLTEYQWYDDLFLKPQEPEDIDYYDDDCSFNDYCPEPEIEYRQPYEFWIVSDFFAEKLRQNNELLTDHWGFWIWGRQTTGQSILIDYIFQKIYDDYKNN